MKLVSLICPTIRFDELYESINSLVTTCAVKDRMEFLIRVDKDDNYGPFLDKIYKDFDSIITIKHIVGDKVEFTNVHFLYNELFNISEGKYLFLWNDDAYMKTNGWDLIVDRFSKDNKFQVLNPLTNHHTEKGLVGAIFPLVPRKWYEIIGHLSLNAQQDEWVYEIAAALGIFRPIPITIFHNQPGMIGPIDMTLEENQIRDSTHKHTNAEYYLPVMYRARQRDFFKIQQYLKNGGKLT